MIDAICAHFERYWAWADGALIAALLFVATLLFTILIMGAL